MQDVPFFQQNSLWAIMQMKSADKIVLKILVNNAVTESSLSGEHGISMLIDMWNQRGTESFPVETGQTSYTLMQNMKKR